MKARIRQGCCERFCSRRCDLHRLGRGREAGSRNRGETGVASRRDAVERNGGADRRDRDAGRRSLPQGRRAGHLRLRAAECAAHACPGRAYRSGEDDEIDRRAAAQKTTGQLELDIPAAEVLKAKADLAAAETLVSKCSISAPFAGVTVDQKMRAFEYATPGQALLGVLDDHALEVELTAPSRWLSRLRPGTRFSLRSTRPERPIRERWSRSAAGSMEPTSRSGHSGRSRARRPSCCLE